MTHEVFEVLAIVVGGLAVAGLVQCLVGWVALARFRGRRALEPAVLPPISILKPLHGDEPMLEEALASICAVEYPAFQVVFGVQDHLDPALSVLQRLRQRFPSVDMQVVIDPSVHGANRKVGNLINMLPHAKHELLLIGDSDMHVAPDYLQRVVAAMRPGVGLVTSLYSGLPATEALPAILGAAQINHAFLPGALLARLLGRQDCLGATMALQRATLAAAGGFEAFKDELADDAMLGRLVRRLGLSVALADTVPATTVPEAQVPRLFEHELRWARTVQSVAPLGFPTSLLQHPIFWAALAIGVSGGEGWAWVLFTAAWVCRAAVAGALDRSLNVASPLTIWCLPFRDLMSVTVILASYRTRRVAWRGRVMWATRAGLVSGKG